VLQSRVAQRERGETQLSLDTVPAWYSLPFSRPPHSFSKKQHRGKGGFNFWPEDAPATLNGLPSHTCGLQVLRRLAKRHDRAHALVHFSTDNVARDISRIVEIHERTKLRLRY